MKAKNLCICAGICAGVASVAVAGDKPDLQKIDNGIMVQPVRIARAVRENGQTVRVGEWMDYGGATQRAAGRVFDCFGDSNSDGSPDDAGGCSLSGARWFFGTAYCNGGASNDMTVASDTNIAAGAFRYDFGWYWTCGGSGSEQCLIGVFTEESNAGNCDADTFDYSGWLLDFGTLSCNPGGYYFSNVDISSVGTWPLPTTGTGSYFVQYLTSSGSALATCAQPMLWGSSNNMGGDPNGPGSQEAMQEDDDNPIDGSHNTTASSTASGLECYDYTFGVCPDPLGAMGQFWGDRSGGGGGFQCDCNGDGNVNTQDFTCFLNLWVQQDPAADCNGDGQVNTQDFTCFLNQWVQGCP